MIRGDPVMVLIPSETFSQLFVSLVCPLFRIFMQEVGQILTTLLSIVVLAKFFSEKMSPCETVAPEAANRQSPLTVRFSCVPSMCAGPTIAVTLAEAERWIPP